MKQLLISAFLSIVLSGSAALIQTFQIDDPNGDITGNTFTDTLVGLSVDGVTFDATITVVGSADLTQNTTGLGIDGDGDPLVSNGEFLTFSMAVFNAVGGDVAFGGFVALDYNYLSDGESSVLSVDNNASSLGDNFFSTTDGADLVDFSVTSPMVFSAIALLPASSNNFRIDDVTARFHAVPEPGTIALFAALGVGCLLVGRKRMRPMRDMGLMGTVRRQ